MVLLISGFVDGGDLSSGVSSVVGVWWNFPWFWWWLCWMGVEGLIYWLDGCVSRKNDAGSDWPGGGVTCGVNLSGVGWCY